MFETTRFSRFSDQLLAREGERSSPIFVAQLSISPHGRSGAALNHCQREAIQGSSVPATRPFQMFGQPSIRPVNSLLWPGHGSGRQICLDHVTCWARLRQRSFHTNFFQRSFHHLFEPSHPLLETESFCSDIGPLISVDPVSLNTKWSWVIPRQLIVDVELAEGHPDNLVGSWLQTLPQPLCHTCHMCRAKQKGSLRRDCTAPVSQRKLLHKLPSGFGGCLSNGRLLFC